MVIILVDWFFGDEFKLTYCPTTRNKPKSGQMSTNNEIMTQNIVNVSILTCVELKKKRVIIL